MGPTFTLLAVTLLATPTPVDLGADARMWTGLADGPWPGAPADAARAYVSAEADRLGLAGHLSELGSARVERWSEGAAVHFAQLSDGVPVRGGHVSVQLDRGGVVRMVVVDWQRDARGLAPTSPAPTLDARAARAAARALGLDVRDGAPARLAIDARGALEWRVPVARGPHRAPAWARLDARTGALLGLASRARSARGRVYPTTALKSALADVDLLDLAPGSSLVGSSVDVSSERFDGDAFSLARWAAPDAHGDYLYAPDPPSLAEPFAEVSAYYHLARAARFFADRFDFALATPVEAWVSAQTADGVPYTNAAASLDEGGHGLIEIGQELPRDGVVVDYAADGLVLTHEYAHLAFASANDLDDHSDYPINMDALGLAIAPQALNEGMSDYWAATAFDDPDVRPPTASGDRELRRLDVVRRCPDDAWGEAHLDGALISSALWAIRSQVGSATADALGWDLIHQVAGSPTFAEIAALLSTSADARVAAGDLDAAGRARIAAILDERRLPQCGRSFPLADGVPQPGITPGASSAARLAMTPDADLCPLLRLAHARLPLALAYAIAVPPEPVRALRVTVDVARFDGAAASDGDFLYGLVVRRGAPPEFELLPLALGDDTVKALKQPTLSDYASPEVATPSTTFELTAADLALVPGETLYLQIVSAHCVDVRTTTTVQWLRPDAAGDDPDASDASSDASSARSEDVAAETARAQADGCGGGDPDPASSLAVPLALALAAALRSWSARAAAARSGRWRATDPRA